MPYTIKFVDEFKESCLRYLPGTLVSFNMADTLRRNCHLGHLEVDKDIAEFDALLRQAIGLKGLVKRVGGDIWLALHSHNSSLHQDILSQFHKEVPCEVGWRSTGERQGSSKSVERLVPTKIIRDVRCVYFPVERRDQLTDTIEALLSSGLTPPGIPTHLNGARIMHEQPDRWSCVETYPHEIPFCPFCEMDQFSWMDGESHVYSGYGTCINCGATVSINAIDPVLRPGS